MKHFKQLVKELPAKKVVFTFGRFQPPTTGHGLLVAAVKHLAEKQDADHVIYASKTQDKKSNPLPVDRKVYYLKRMFPGANFVAASTDVPTFIQAAKQLNKKYKNIVMVAGSDRVAEYQKILNKYNGKDFHFDTVEVVSAGERDPDSEGASGMSGTKMRDAAKKGDFDSFKKGLPSTLTTVDGKRLMNEIREGMGLEQIHEKVELQRDDIREAYHKGDIYNIGDIVESNGQLYKIEKRGSNHLLLREQSGALVNKWLQDVQQSNKEFVLEGTLQEMKYTSSDKIKVARVIAGALGVEDVEKSSNAEQLVNVGLRKVRSKPMRPEYVDVLHNMLQTAREAGIKFDEKLVPQKAQKVDEELNQLDELSKQKLTNYGNKAALSMIKHGVVGKIKAHLGAALGDYDAGLDDADKYFKRDKGLRRVNDRLSKMKQQTAEGVKQPNGTDKVGDAAAVLSEKTPKLSTAEKLDRGLKRGGYDSSAATNKIKEIQAKLAAQEKQYKAQGTLKNEELEEAEYWKKSSWQKKMSAAAKKERLEREKKEAEPKQVKESYEDAEDHKKQADAAKAKGNLGAYHAHMVNHHEAMGQWHETKGRNSAADSEYAKAEKHHEQSLKHPFKEDISIDESHVEFRIDNRDKIKGDHKTTFADHSAKVSDSTDKATYVTVPSHKANAFKSAMKSKHGVNVELAEEVHIEEGKMGELHDTISRHLDKHIADFKSGHTGHDQFGSKVLAAHKSVAKEHGLEHKHAAKFVNDYVDSKLNEEAITEWTVKHDGVDADHPHAKLFHGKKDVVNHLTKYKDSAEKRAELLKNKGFKNVRIEEQLNEISTHTLDKAWHGRYQQALAAKHGSPEHQKAHKSMGKIGDVMKKRISDKLTHMAKHDPEAYKKSAQQVADDNTKRGWSNEETETVHDLLEQIATAAMMGKDTEELKRKLTQLRFNPDAKNNESDQEAEQQAEPIEKKIGHSMTSPIETDTTRKMKVRYHTEAVTTAGELIGEKSKKSKADLDEDQATAEYKIKTYYDNALGKTVTRKIRPHRVTFSGSKKNAEPEVDSPGEDEVKEGIVGMPAGDMGAMPMGAPEPFTANPSIIEPDLKKKIKDKKALNLKEEQEEEEENEHDGISTESDLEDMAKEVDDVDDIIDLYDEDELIIVDDEGKEVKHEVNEEALNEVLSRMERMRAKIRFAQSQAKRQRKLKIALKTPSSMQTLNGRARKLAVKLMKQRLARKPLDKLSLSEKERIEKIVQRRKKLINRLAMKLVSRVKKIEQTRLHRG